jgi:mannose-6-phosphate isomerase class I
MLALPRPVLLSSDVYTSPARTPWAGARLSKHFGKRVPPQTRIGESWELSLGPELPSRTHDGTLLARVIGEHPGDWLGPSGDRAAGLLVKLLDADQALSLQIHPHDDDPGLGPDDSGKPEAWYVVGAERGAWIAFGWGDGVTKEDVVSALGLRDGSLTSLLQRVEVEVGDCFVVDAGTPHAVGPGVTLVEPQYVARGRRGVTYRYWDWERRYDAEGRLDPSGEPRPLHLERALEATRWEARGRALLERSFRRAGPARRDAPLEFELLAGQPGSPNASALPFLPSEWLRIVRIAGSGERPFFHGESLHALTVLEGAATLRDRRRDAVVRAGPKKTLAIPARHEDLWLVGKRLHALRSSIKP